MKRWAIAALAAGAWIGHGQPLSFEAASVKPAVQQPGRGPGPLGGGPGTNSPGQLTGIANLKTLVERAYEMKPYQVIGPAWMESERYEIAAKVPDGATRSQVAEMLRTLLAERFHLAAHRETRELPMLELVIGKNGAKLKVSDPDGAAGSETAAGNEIKASPNFQRGADGLPELTPGTKLPRSYTAMVAGTDGIRIKLWARQETMAHFADELSSYLSRPVFDKTGLDGRYDFSMDWAMESAGGAIPRVGPPPDMIDSFNAPIGANDSTTIFAAVERQLGLKLEARRGPVVILVVDRADKVPAGN